METILGLTIIYAWIHGAIIVGKKIQNTTKYENVVLIVALASATLFIVGNL